ncbi:PilC/PilY family type IV pilus protein [Acinetobacter johnsonii]|uniref:pilus assembly protein n=1 Tax=Acinetobacter johnsonii TaxID=40214 RepID=UPI00244CC547|nr:PilC/PilY family type IV pilus protein [Acinetobacter johnsonii]MDH1698113.1 PilC/PilY family type IV pilus protein [Acinetobacter johnsonii]
MKNKAKLITFNLSVLSTLMLCVTANNNASDIEIYKAPNASDGKARVMLNLDNSTFMSGDPDGTNGGNGTIGMDFPGVECKDKGEKYKIESETWTTGTKSYTYEAAYCVMPKATYDGLTGAAKTRVTNLCPSTDSGDRKCYSRLTMLKRGALKVINDAALGSNVKIGLNFFPQHTAYPQDGSATVTQPVPLAWYNASTGAICDTAPYTGCTDGRDQLSRIVAGIRKSETNLGEKEVPVALGYGKAARGLLTDSLGVALDAADQCSGYGIFTLTSGMPVDDDIGAGRGDLNFILRGGTDSQLSGSSASQCANGGSGGSTGNTGAAWQCVNAAATRLMAGKAKISVPVKSVVVSYGTDMTLGLPDLQPYDPELTSQTTINTDVQSISDGKIKENKRYAAYAGLNGGGGYNSVQDPDSLSEAIINFIADVGKVDIPYMTTGAPTIPQDPLNPVLVQSNAYFSQFKPTPNKTTTVGSQLWVGNMKKYRVNNLGRLVGKNGDIVGAAEEKEEVTDDLGRLITGTHDYWAPNVDSDETIAKGAETLPGSELFARMGGAWSQLPLGTSVLASVTVENRKLLTNRVITSGVASEGTSLTHIERKNYAPGGSAVGDPKATDIISLLDLRQLGAVMHSSPLLLSNEGKMTYNASTKQLESSGREDYVLFGSTQGLLHVVKADDYTSTNGGGKEIFAFVPNEMVENQSKAFLTPDQTTGGTANLFYGIDAPWTAYTEYVPKADGTLTVGQGKPITVDGTTSYLQGKQLVYGGLRMGGRSYYALDLHDINNPSLKFHINPASAEIGTPLSYMGQSWSKPKITWVKWKGQRKLVMFVGGGYDAGYETDTYNQINGTGAGVYMFSADGADAGSLLWWVSKNAETTDVTTNPDIAALHSPNMAYSVVSEIKTTDRDNDGLVDHLYFGDLGGQVFRIDLNNKASITGAFATRSTRILNMHALGGKSPRFYAAPSFAIFKDSQTSNLFAAISIGSGNLSHPLAAYDEGSGWTSDALYNIYDKDVTRSDLYTSDITLNTQDAAVGATGTRVMNELTMANRFMQTATNMAEPIAPYATAGWYYKLPSGTKIQHEKIFSSPTAIDYDLYVSSYDASRLGLTGECGGGVQGVSTVQIFCMPYGQCSASGYPDRTSTNYSDDHGPGIQNHTIASGGDGTTRLVGGAIIGNNLNDQYATTIKFIAQRWYEK